MRTVRLFGLFGFFLLVIITWLSLPLTAGITPTLASVQNPLSRSSSRLVKPNEVPSGLEAGEWQAINKQMVLHRHRVR